MTVLMVPSEVFGADFGEVPTTQLRDLVRDAIRDLLRSKS
jgi:hypothetical protein